MQSTTALSTTGREGNSMEQQWLWYLAGAFDTGGAITVKIQQNDSYAIGYDFRPTLYLSRQEPKTTVFGMMEEYCEEQKVRYRIEDTGHNSHRWVVDDVESIENFLKPLMGGFIQQQEQVEVMLSEIVPAVKEDKHQTEEGLLELMDSVAVLREGISSRKSSKYDAEYFRDEWGL